MGRAARNERRERKHTAAIRAAEPAGPIVCAAEVVTVLQAVEAADGRPGRRPSFNILAYSGGLLRVGWSRPLVVDLAGLRAGRTTVLLDHMSDQIVGQGQASIAEGQITVAGDVTGDLTPDTPAGKVVSHAKTGFVWAASIGVSPERVEPVDADQTVTVNGREFRGPIYVVRAGRLGEVSFVGIGADETATATVAAAQRGRSNDTVNFEQWLKAKGLENNRMTAAEYQALLAQFQAEHPTAPVSAAAQPATMPAATILANGQPAAGQQTQTATQSAPAVHAAGFSRIDAEIAEGRRREALENMTVAQILAADRDPVYAGQLRDLLARAIEAGTSVRDYEVELLRSRQNGIRVRGAGQFPPADTNEVLEAAALLASGHRGEAVVRQLGERTVEAAERRFRGGIGLQEILLAAANANGYVGRQRVGHRNWSEIVGWALPGVRASGMSSVDLGSILGNVANKAMAAVAAEPQWLVPRIFGPATHQNFYAHTVCSLAINGELQEVAPTGELKHLNLSDETYTRQVKTRGAILRLSREAIVNDDLGAFNSMARGLARKAYTTREKVGFTLLMASGAGASHFTAARGNYVSGATSAFGVAGLGAAKAAFRKLTGPDGDPIMVDPAIVLLPPTLEQEGQILLKPASTLLVSGYTGTSAKTMTGSANPYAGQFGGLPLCSPWLENTAVTGNSAAYWYMLAAPAAYPCYEIAYLNGQQEPTVEYFGLETEADQLGVAWRAFWDFGVAAAEWRAGCKMAGS